MRSTLYHHRLSGLSETLDAALPIAWKARYIPQHCVKEKRIAPYLGCRPSSRHECTKRQSILFARNSCGNRCLKDSPCSGGRNAAGTPSLQKSVKAHKPKKCMKHTTDSGAFLLCPDSPLRSKQKAKSRAARKRGTNLCFLRSCAGKALKLTFTG